MVKPKVIGLVSTVAFRYYSNVYHLLGISEAAVQLVGGGLDRCKVYIYLTPGHKSESA